MNGQAVYDGLFPSMGLKARANVTLAKSSADSLTKEDVEKLKVDRKDVLQAKAGDVAAFRRLVEQYQQRVLTIALGVLGNHEDAQDVAQEAFLKAYRHLPLFRGDSSFYTWLYRIVFNLAVDFSRRRYRHVENSVGDMATVENALGVSTKASRGRSESSGFLSSTPSPEDQVERQELRRSISKAMVDLSPEHRTVIVLREIEGLSYAEISHIVGCSKGTVMSRLHHARKRLQKALAEFLPEIQKKGIRKASVEDVSDLQQSQRMRT